MGFFKKLFQSTFEESAEALQSKKQSKVEDLHSAIADLNTNESSSEASDADEGNPDYSWFIGYDKNDCIVCLIKVGPNELMLKGLLHLICGLDDDAAQDRIDLCHQGHNAIIAKHVTEVTAIAIIDGVRAMGGDAMIF